jgi:hypothetical protein
VRALADLARDGLQRLAAAADECDREPVGGERVRRARPDPGARAGVQAARVMPRA